MEIETHSISFTTNGNCDIIDITSKVQNLVSNADFKEGSALIFAGVPGMTLK